MSSPKPTTTLFVVPGSHPSIAGRLMLEHKRIAYRRVDLIPALHKPILRALGFRATTVPAAIVDGVRIQGTLNLSRQLDAIRPDPPLFPAEPTDRRLVEAAERWGEQVLQPIPRRLSWWALRRDRTPLASFAVDARLGVPLSLALATAAPVIWAEVRINGADDDAVEADLAALPGLIDQVDRWLGDGLLGGSPPTAADFQIAASLRLLLCFEDLHTGLRSRPAGEFALRLVPEFPGHIGPVIPPAWIGD
jgi:glutathione S-transferase